MAGEGGSGGLVAAGVSGSELVVLGGPSVFESKEGTEDAEEGTQHMHGTLHYPLDCRLFAIAVALMPFLISRNKVEIIDKKFRQSSGESPRLIS